VWQVGCSGYFGLSGRMANNNITFSASSGSLKISCKSWWSFKKMNLLRRYGHEE